jgi:DNA-binding MarR family transcriptional regulator
VADRDALGEFEHHVLLAALRLGEGAFTAPIVEELEERTGRSVAPASVYVTLRRLEKKGHVTTRIRTDDSAGANRRRRFVRVTDEGVEVLRSAQADLQRLWEGMDPLMAPGGGSA